MFPAKIWFMKTSARIVKYESRVIKSRIVKYESPVIKSNPEVDEKNYICNQIETILFEFNC